MNRFPLTWRQALPPTPRGARVGLLGGSFDPPHAGHVLITELALTRLSLHRVWWLVTPGNPLKVHGPASLERRMAAARAIISHPRVAISDIESRLKLRFTAQTLRALRRLRPDLRFVWLMGADNLHGFHRWRDWRGIMATLPIAVLPRPGHSAAGLARAAQIGRKLRCSPGTWRRLGARQPGWVLVNGPTRAISSTQLRRAGHWQA